MAIDLHLHSTASDGSFTPDKVVEYAHSIGLKCIALTDHDTVDGLAQAERRATELKMPFIPGIEMTTIDRDQEVHVLGYFIDPENSELLDELARIHQRIELRVKQIIDNLASLGFEMSFEEVCDVAKGGTLGRPHIARVMVNRGYIKNNQEAFDKFIAGEYAGAYEDRVVAEFEALLPDEPPWKAR